MSTTREAHHGTQFQLTEPGHRIKVIPAKETTHQQLVEDCLEYGGIHGPFAPGLPNAEVPMMVPGCSTIRDRLARMQAEAIHIETTLMVAPIATTGTEEAALWQRLQIIQRELTEIRRTW